MKRIALIALLLGTAAAHAGEGQSLAPLRDPWLPPEARTQARNMPETRGPALHAQVERKLREKFDAADRGKRGSITREEARAAQLGVIADNFEAIDSERRGRVTFEDFKHYLRAKGARHL
jgi:hypothetical protein